jgi:hypothetical protein
MLLRNKAFFMGTVTKALVFLLAAIVLRSILLIFFPAGIDADECVEAILGMNFWNHPGFLVGWPGQDYMGSIEIYLLAFAFPFIGSSVGSIRFIMLVVVACQLACIAYIAYRSFGHKAAVISMIASCALSPFAFDWELRARGYQPMVLLVLCAIMLRINLSGQPCLKPKRKWLTTFAIGLICGIAVWSNELALFLVFPLVLFPGPSRVLFNRYLFPLILGGCVGYLPRILYNLLSDFDGIKMLAGSLLHVSSQSMHDYSVSSFASSYVGLTAVKEHLMAIADGMGIPMLFLIAVAITLLFKHKAFNKINWNKHWLLAGIAVSIGMILLINNRARYIELAVPYCCIFSGALFSRCLSPRILTGRWAVLALTAFAAGAIVFTSAVTQKSVKSDEQALVPFLKSNDCHYGISGYYIAQKVNYYSRGSIATSSLGGPYFSTRFLDIERSVAENGADFIVYDVGDDPIYPESLESFLISAGIGCKKDTVGDRFIVFHGFSRKIVPGEFLPQDAKKHFNRHSFNNPRKIKQEEANALRRFNGVAAVPGHQTPQ